MGLNCKPGDRATIVRNVLGSECRAKMIGWVVTVRALFVARFSGQAELMPAWTYEGPVRDCPTFGGPCPSMVVIPDADLKPLPPPEHVDDFDLLEEIFNDLEPLLEKLPALLPPEGFLPDRLT